MSKRKRIKVKGHYMEVRQRSTSKGKKGTIKGKWKPEREPSFETKASELIFGKSRKRRK
jgi:hypothetical protein